MKLDDLTIGEAKEISALFSKTNCRKSIKDGGYRIVVLQRGWVAVGKFSQEGSDCQLDNAAIIRIWGTSKGLPEIVDGPINGKTVLDKSPRPIRFHELTAVLSLDASEEGWKKHLS